ncbi:MAG: hypothetical protein JW731_08335 [Bacteroidales bacterium]|nr:hypothetical protein [Bacteroidales bacterium]
MKQVKMTIVFSLILTIGFAQSSSNFEKTMDEKTGELKNVKTEQEMMDLANQFERIAAAEKAEWLPAYYAAFCYINMTFFAGEPDQKDALLDKAQKLIDQAEEIKPNESELLVLQGFLHQGRIQVDPMNRGMQYSMKANEAFGKAKALNPENPRTYYLQGQNLLHTPEAFGGGAKAACPLLKTALGKYHTFVPEKDYAPNWGKENTEKLVQKSCNE